MALCRRRSRSSAPSVPAETPSASLTKTASTSASTASGGNPLVTAIALIGLPSATMESNSSSAGGRAPSEGNRRTRAAQGARTGRFAAGGDGPDGVHQLVTLGDVVLQEVAVASRTLGQEGHGVLGIVVLRQNDDPGPRVPLADLLGGVDPFPIEGGGHPDVRDQDLGRQSGGALHHLVVVGRHADDLEVLVPLDQRTYALPDDQIVVGQEHRDPARLVRVVIHRL